jgi:hypothetical protein
MPRKDEEELEEALELASLFISKSLECSFSENSTRSLAEVIKSKRSRSTASIVDSTPSWSRFSKCTRSKSVRTLGSDFEIKGSSRAKNSLKCNLFIHFLLRIVSYLSSVCLSKKISQKR